MVAWNLCVQSKTLEGDTSVLFSPPSIMREVMLPMATNSPEVMAPEFVMTPVPDDSGLRLLASVSPEAKRLPPECSSSSSEEEADPKVCHKFLSACVPSRVITALLCLAHLNSFITLSVEFFALQFYFECL
jgi:hypothetical protein